MKEIKTFEEHVIVNKSETDGNLSAEYHVNKKKGLKPYLKKGGKYEEVKTKSIPKNVEYLKSEKVEKYNELAAQIIKLQEQQNKIMK
jgi:ribosomal protein S15P/S13E